MSNYQRKARRLAECDRLELVVAGWPLPDRLWYAKTVRELVADGSKRKAARVRAYRMIIRAMATRGQASAEVEPNPCGE